MGHFVVDGISVVAWESNNFNVSLDSALSSIFMPDVWHFSFDDWSCGTAVMSTF